MLLRPCSLPRARLTRSWKQHLADAADLPFEDGAFDLVIAFMCLQDIDGLEITFVSAHRPLQAYVDALAGAGFLVERLRETDVPDAAITLPRGPRWQRMPLFLHIGALKPATNVSTISDSVRRIQ